MLLAVGMIAVADMSPPGRDRPLVIVAGVPDEVLMPAVVNVGMEVPTEVARGGPMRAVVVAPVNAPGYQPLKRWRAWNREQPAV